MALSCAHLSGTRFAPTAWHSRPSPAALRRPGCLPLRNSLLGRAAAVRKEPGDTAESLPQWRWDECLGDDPPAPQADSKQRRQQLIKEREQFVHQRFQLFRVPAGFFAIMACIHWAQNSPNVVVDLLGVAHFLLFPELILKPIFMLLTRL